MADEVVTDDDFFTDLEDGNLPAVSWLIPDVEESERPAARLDVRGRELDRQC
jgi:phospholipase C